MLTAGQNFHADRTVLAHLLASLERISLNPLPSTRARVVKYPSIVNGENKMASRSKRKNSEPMGLVIWDAATNFSSELYQ